VLRKLIPAATLAVLVAIAVAQPAGAAAPSGLIAPASACPNQTDPAAPAAVQVRAMVCMTNFARERGAIAALTELSALDRAARHKSADILRCDEFSHEACGRKFTFWIERVGYLGGGCASVGENIAWGTGRFGSVRSIFTAWIHSPGHRANILGSAFLDLGVGLRIGRLEGHAGAHVWTQEFGSNRC
jgi:uncharacterized protein YkwD